jgi:iron complex transport system permease protein
LYEASGRLNLLFYAVLSGGFWLAYGLLARLHYLPAGRPVGLVTALPGVPFFVYLLKKASNS